MMTQYPLGLDNAALALFIPVESEAVLLPLSVTEVTDGIRIVVVAVRW